VTRRPHGTGSVYYDVDGARWVGTYEAGWTPRGTRRRRKVTGPSEKAVRAKLVKALRETQDPAATVGRMTVKRWADDWLAITVTRHRPSTYATNRSAVAKWIIPTIGHKRLDTLTPADVRSVTRAMLDAGLTPATAHRAQAVLEKMLRDARSEGHVVPERVLDVEGPGAAENDRDAIPTDDALAILAASVGTPDETRWVAAFLEGMRQGECLGLTWDCVDLDRGLIDVSWQLKALPYKVPRDRSSGFRVPVGYVARQLVGATHLVRPKTASGRRVIPLVPWMVEALTKGREAAPASPHGLVWPDLDDGAPRRPDRDRAAWYALQDRAGVRHSSGRHYVLHEIRHASATLLRTGGADDQTITAILGHASILSTNAYLHTDQARVRAASELLASRLGLGAPRIEP
jgi:integrase